MQSALWHQFNYSLQDNWSFDPFGAQFNTPQPRDRYSHGSRANYITYSDDNDYEAEQNQDVVSEIQKFENIHVNDDQDENLDSYSRGEFGKILGPLSDAVLNVPRHISQSTYRVRLKDENVCSLRTTSADICRRRGGPNLCSLQEEDCLFFNVCRL
ncbi:hypothetical protein QVD17_15106 [Tagetes erecta]|uniref:Uncharacterized protein n=1 Tax=Tagetes erecta TaxID=13708 RepID=A0AAD8KNQ0_TARER|nr:hypothetical protein QVD17_15106 [Tagetes erecta]